AGARIGSLAVIAAGAVVGAGASVEFAVVSAGATVGAEATVTGSIVGEQARVGVGCVVAGLSVVGPGATVGNRNMLDHGIRIAAGESIAADTLRFS
ncbi:MAG: NDP-sugar synthase, partial [Actinobacteria bacterium]|nr:NDP-sugar synthase [Actinomycetota bacterium]